MEYYREAVHDMDNKDMGSIYDCCYLFYGDTEIGKCLHVTVTSYIEQSLKTGDFVCVMFKSVWEGG